MKKQTYWAEFCLPIAFIKEVEKYEKLATEYAVNEVPRRLGSFDLEEGDVVKVTNPRVRKFKGETFKIEEIKKFKIFQN